MTLLEFVKATAEIQETFSDMYDARTLSEAFAVQETGTIHLPDGTDTGERSAKQHAGDAASSASAASSEASAASDAASNAAGSASDAAGSASDAAGSASDAAGSADRASQWASKLGGPVIPPSLLGGGSGLYSARHYARIAQAGAEQSVESIEVVDGDLVVTLVSGEVLTASISADIEARAPLVYDQAGGSLSLQGDYLTGVQASVDAPEETVTLSWDALAWAQRYEVQLYVQGVEGYLTLGQTAATSFDTPLLDAVVARYAVVAQGIPHAEVTPDSVDTTPPTITGYDVSVNGLTLTTSLDSDETLGQITVRLYRVTDAGTLLPETTLRLDAFSATGGTYSADYMVSRGGSYRLVLLSAQDEQQNEGASGEALAVTVLPVPGVPTDLTADIAGSGEVTLTWTDPTGSTPALDYVRVMRSEGDATSFQEIATVQPGVETYSESPADTGATTWYYALIAVGANGQTSARTRPVRVSGINHAPFIGLPGDFSS